MYLKIGFKMFRYLLVFIFLLSGLDARENPFFPIEADDIPLTTNQIEEDSPLKRASIKLPSTARTIESVTISYKNIDGSIAEEKIDLQNSIDWHLPIFITQTYQEISQETSKAKMQKPQAEVEQFKVVASLDFIVFKVVKNKIFLETKDKLLRSFLLVNPHRIVVDFERETDMRSFTKNIKNEDVTQIKVGTHKGYYRVVIELDGSYRYNEEKTANGYIFTLR